jgi:hypothetical protein
MNLSSGMLRRCVKTYQRFRNAYCLLHLMVEAIIELTFLHVSGTIHESEWSTLMLQRWNIYHGDKTRPVSQRYRTWLPSFTESNVRVFYMLKQVTYAGL